MSQLDDKREVFVRKWVKQLSKKLQKPEEDLLVEGLTIDDFGSTNVYIEHEDGSHTYYKYAFYIENEDEYAVFTEHNDYHEFKKIWLTDIQEDTGVDLERVASIKWIGDGNAYLEIEKQKIYLNKLQLKSLQQEITWFINYYGEDFSPKQLHLLQNLTGKENFHDQIYDDDENE